MKNHLLDLLKNPAALRTSTLTERRVRNTVATPTEPAVRPVQSAMSAPASAEVLAAQASPAPSDAMVPGVRQQLSPTGGRLDVQVRRAAMLPSPPPNTALAQAHAYAATLNESRMVSRPGEKQTVVKSAVGQRSVVSPLGAKAHVVRATSHSAKK